MLNAIILAGAQAIKGRNDSGNKALYCINGKAMIEYVIDAVRKADGIGKIVVVGPKAQLQEILYGKADAIIDSDGSVMDNVMAGVRYCGYDNDVLICTSDIPLITPEAINDFIAKSKAEGADFCYPIVEKQVNERKFPGIERTYVKIKEGRFTGGNIFYVNPRVIEKGFRMADRLIKSRKNPVKVARILSLDFMIRLLLGNLTISGAEKKFSKITNIRAKAIISEYPELGNDVDKPSDLAIVEAHLSRWA